MQKPVVFLDRDGTINEEVGYLNHRSRLKFIKGAFEGIRLLNEAGFSVVVVTNQSGPARGYFPESLVFEVNELIAKEAEKAGARIDGFYVCLHHPDEGCSCRKPKPGLVYRAAYDLDLDLERAYVVGDRWVDLELARNIGAKGVLVLTGYGRGELEYVLPKKGLKPDIVAEDLLHAARHILLDYSERTR